MKGFTIRQPWASMISAGVKSIETRTWRTPYRGELLICSAVHKARPAGPYAHLAEPFLALPRGVAICLVTVVDCRPMTRHDERAACCELYDGAWAWVLENPRPVEPFAVKGQLKYFEVSDALVKPLARAA